MHGEDRPNIKTQLVIGALKFAEFPDHISMDYGGTYKQTIQQRSRLVLKYEWHDALHAHIGIGGPFMGRLVHVAGQLSSLSNSSISLESLG